ncbi:MAG: ATP-dependent DNA ligase [Nocardia sp.]|nr:ATP-dependent DNA ligase [Nocardia sp.]
MQMPPPMLASSGPAPTDGPRWAVEWKWDGARCTARASGGVATMMSRNANALHSAFPEIARAVVTAAAGREIIVDGELVAPDPETGAPNFGRLSRRLGVVRPSRSLMAEVPTRLYVFDLLGLDGEDLRGLAYQKRRELLAQLDLDANSEVIVVPPYYTDVPVATMLEVAAQNGVEGVVVKRLDSSYKAGRSALWRKVPLRKSTEVIIVGWLRNSRGGAEFGSLLVAAHDPDGDLILLGAVGSGFSRDARRALQRQLDELAIDESPLQGPVPRTIATTASWVTPRLVGDVHYRERTVAGLRHPSWRGLRFDKDLTSVTAPPIG